MAEVPGKPDYVDKAIEITLRLGILLLIVGWCLMIISPFASPVIWGLIISVVVYPLYDKLRRKLGGRAKLAAFLITFFFLLLLIIPTWLLADSLIEGIEHLRSIYQDGKLIIPHPDDRVKDWPAIAKPVVDLWQLASENLDAVMMKYSAEIRKVGTALISLIATTGIGILSFLASIIISGFFLTYSESGGQVIRKIFKKFSGDQGEHFAEVSEVTIRNVVKGILGVAFIQSLLASIGFVIAGVPFAGFWTLICLILAIVQIGIGPVIIGVVIYMFSTADTLTASLLTAWLVLVGISDNILKPILLGRGAPVPMLVVFIGSVGGFIVSGFLGLFLGPVILSVGYKLFLQWIEEHPTPPGGKEMVPDPSPKNSGQESLPSPK